MDELENKGCPRKESRYLYRMMKSYSIPPFDCHPQDYPVWFVDDVEYFDLLAYYKELPYRIATTQKYIKDASAKQR